MPSNFLPFILSLLCLALPVFPSSLAAAQTETEIHITARDGTDLTLYQHSAEGDYLVLWVGGGSGLTERGSEVAQSLAQLGIEVWQIDFATALFQLGGNNFLRNLDATYVVDLIEAAHAQTGKKIVLLSRAYGAIPLLRGATLWQQQNQRQAQLIGAVLISPDFLATVPELGFEAEYLPIIHATNIPLMIYQAGRRSNRAQFSYLLTSLQSRNPNVYFSIMPGVAGLFYRNDTSPATLAQLRQFPQKLVGAIRLLAATPQDGIAPQYSPPSKIISRTDVALRPYRANPTPPPVRLNDIHDKPVRLEDYTGKITLVNFWASWCPPCVEEIPSLNRLVQKMQDKPFELVSINYAESPETITAFLKQVRVDFPVLLDTTGATAGQWNVIAFPSTFVIGPDGRIRYGVNAAISWDSPEVINALNQLLNGPS